MNMGWHRGNLVLFVLVGVTLFLSSSSSGTEEDLVFGPASGGVRVAVRIQHDRFAQGSPVPVKVFLRNEGTNTAVILPYAQPQDGWTVTGPKSELLEPRDYWLDGGKYNTTRRTRVGPGETVTILETDLAHDYDLSKVGKYRAHFRYVLTAQSFRENTEASRADLDAAWADVQKEGVWIGEAVAPEISFLITRPARQSSGGL